MQMTINVDIVNRRINTVIKHQEIYSVLKQCSNPVYDYCVGEGADSERVRQLITADSRIETVHITKQRGSRGHCPTKDTQYATVRSLQI